MRLTRPETLAVPIVLVATMLAACSSQEDATASPSATPSSTSNIPDLGLSPEFCATAEQLYARDAEIAAALGAFDLTGMTTEQASDPALFAEYVAAMDLDGWESWRALYAQASDQAAGTEMTEWIDAILTTQDALYEIYAQAASATDNLLDWSAEVSALADARADEVQALGTAALEGSQVTMAECGVPLSVYAGDLLGYAAPTS